MTGGAGFAFSADNRFLLWIADGGIARRHREDRRQGDDPDAADIHDEDDDHLPGAEAPSVIELRQGGGRGRTLEVDPALAALVGASDGELTVGQLSDAIAELLEVDAAALRADLLPRVRELVFIGMLRLA